MQEISAILANEFQIKPVQVQNTIKLIDDGNTIPFIARYRKEVTGGLSDEILRNLNERLAYLRNLQNRREEVTRLIDEQGKLTEELVQAITSANTLADLEDIYRPYKQKKKTRATVAKAKGRYLKLFLHKKKKKTFMKSQKAMWMRKKELPLLKKQ